MVTQGGPGTASEAATWAATYGLTNVHVWADTTNYMYWNYVSQPVIDSYYPSVLIIDADTMTMTVLQQTGVTTQGSAVDAILNAEHPCADY